MLLTAQLSTFVFLATTGLITANTKGAIKLHTELDLSGNLPCFLLMSNGKMSDIRTAKENIPILPDSIYTFDKVYYDLNWFQAISDANAFFVTRIKNNAQIEFLGQHREANKKTWCSAG